MDIFLELEKIAATGHGSNSELAKFLLTYNDDYACLKIKDITQLTLVSSACATRLAQVLGLNGFNELKFELNKQREANKQINNIQSLGVENYLFEVNEGLKNSLMILDYEQVVIAANIIHNANKIILLSIGETKLYTADFEYKLAKINLDVRVGADYAQCQMHFRNLQLGDVAIIVTYTGYSNETYELAKLAKENHSKVIVISSNEKFTSVSDVLLQLNKGVNLHTGISLTKKIGITSVLDILYLEVLKNDPNRYSKLLSR